MPKIVPSGPPNYEVEKFQLFAIQIQPEWPAKVLNFKEWPDLFDMRLTTPSDTSGDPAVNKGAVLKQIGVFLTSLVLASTSHFGSEAVD